MALLTLSEAKLFLQIPDSDTYLDDTLEVFLPALEEFVCNFCNNDFIDSNGNKVYPYGLKLAATSLLRHLLEHKGISAESIGDYSISFFVDIPRTILMLFKPYKRVVFV